MTDETRPETRVLLSAPSDAEVRLRVMEAVWPQMWGDLAAQRVGVPEGASLLDATGAVLQRLEHWVLTGSWPGRTEDGGE